jgi:hypothetical protein
MATTLVSRVHRNGLHRNVCPLQLFRGKCKAPVLCVFPEPHPDVRLKQTPGLATGHLQAKSPANLVHLEVKRSRMGIDVLFEPFGTPIHVTSGTCLSRKKKIKESICGFSPLNDWLLVVHGDASHRLPSIERHLKLLLADLLCQSSGRSLEKQII